MIDTTKDGGALAEEPVDQEVDGSTDGVDSPVKPDVQQTQLSPEEVAEKVAAIKELLATIEERFYVAVNLGQKEHRDKKNPAVKASIERYKAADLERVAEMRDLAVRLTSIYRAIGDSTEVNITTFKYDDLSRHRGADVTHNCKATGIDLCGEKRRVSFVEGYGNTYGSPDKLKQVIEEAERLVVGLPPVEAVTTERRGKVARVFGRALSVFGRRE